MSATVSISERTMNNYDFLDDDVQYLGVYRGPQAVQKTYYLDPPMHTLSRSTEEDTRELQRIYDRCRAIPTLIRLEVATKKALDMPKSDWFRSTWKRAFGRPNGTGIYTLSVDIKPLLWEDPAKPPISARLPDCTHIETFNIRGLNWRTLNATNIIHCPIPDCFKTARPQDLEIDRFLLYIQLNRHLDPQQMIRVHSDGSYEHGPRINHARNPRGPLPLPPPQGHGN